PLLSQVRMGGRKAIRGRYLLVGAKRTSPSSLAPFIEGRLPFVVLSFRALPPNLFPATRHDVARRYVPVLGRMPLFGKSWLGHRQAICLADVQSEEKWTPASLGPAIDGRLPYMVLAFRTLPPDFFCRPGNYIKGRFITILVGMPFLADIGVKRP